MCVESIQIGGEEAMMDDLKHKDDPKDKTIRNHAKISEEETNIPNKKKRVQKEETQVAVKAYREVEDKKEGQQE